MLLAVVVLVFQLAGPAAVVRASEVTVAVAANFSEPLESLVADFEDSTGHSVRIVTGSTGTLYAQIVNGAPFDVLLAADQRRPRLLGESGHALAGTQFTYALGRLALWSADRELLEGEGAQVLREGGFRRLAIANPDLAPYGEAARQALRSLGVWDQLQSRIVVGENIGQTFAIVASGNAELGLVALSYVLSPRNTQAGSRWDVPPARYEPIRQDAIVLRRGADNDAARAFIAWLRSDEAHAVLERFGYSLQ